MNRSVSVAIVALVVIGFLAGSTGVGVPMAMSVAGVGESASSQSVPATQSTVQGSSTTDTMADESIAGDSQDFDTTTFQITVHENGSATWTFQHEQRFDTENESEERAAFEEFAEEFEEEETGLYERFVTRTHGMTESGAETTDREMEATNFNRSATVDDRFGTRGIVEMSFTWNGFAKAEDGTVEVGDVFEGMYIGSDQSIVIIAGDGLTFDRIGPEDEARPSHNTLENADSVLWQGEQQFLDGNPRAVFVTEGAGGGNDETGSAVSAITNSDDAAWHLALGALVVLGVGGAAVWYRRQHSGSGTDDRTAAAGATTQSNVTSAEQTDLDTAPPSAGESHGDDSTNGASPLTNEELLTDEDRVVRLIRENGGRMKQVNIVEETGWSKSKVSMLLSDMEEEGTISKLRVGRENIISLEGFEPEATKSPFEE
ncbi:helix-turn-helix transcriptional regulator [Natronorubrum texcoconense]|uniref:IclR helix-turn-helix domain-containing protein n=1 Tax=Natronorubrum texcoconense TaxID=1095776 RepID=A0A1G8V0I9_9EURY|nr:helix-turn-helix domain-containing protein [Natronorubrum texcoconense]SDJ59489.1 IclR helix-turn-helix domain-containing protein [Natronorubrum texcoconense]